MHSGLAGMGHCLAVLVVLSLFGCGDDDDVVAPDAATFDAPAAFDAPPTPDAGPLMTDQCPATYGLTAVSMTFELATQDIGFDLDGDDAIDNILGSSGGIRIIINNDFSNSLADGSLRTLAELRDFGGLGADDTDMSFAVYGGEDADMPQVTADDFDGDEDYYFQHSWVNSLTCEPRAAVPGTYISGLVNIPETEFSFYVSSLGGFLDIHRARIQATIEADTAGFKTVDGMPAVIGGALGICPLQKATAAIGENVLHAVVQIFMLQPDIDLDGDGLEEIETDAGGIIQCKDGNGDIIAGAECGCDPRMQDGFSIAFTTHLVGATILGPDPNR